MVVLLAIGILWLAWHVTREEHEPSRQQYDVQAVVDYPVAREVKRAVRRAVKPPVDPCEKCAREECLNCPEDDSLDDDCDEDDEE